MAFWEPLEPLQTGVRVQICELRGIKSNLRAYITRKRERDAAGIVVRKSKRDGGVEEEV